MHTRHLLAVLLPLGIFTGVPAGADEVDSSQPLRYSLPVGRKLVYADSNSYDGVYGLWRKTGTWEILVTRENPDGSRHLIFHRARTVDSSKSNQIQREAEQFHWADVFPDGRIAASTPVSSIHEVCSFFPKLPEDGTQAKAGWSYEMPRALFGRTFSVAADDAGEVKFDFTQTGPLVAIQERTTSGTFRFDSAKGLVNSASEKDEYRLRAGNNFSDELTLVSDTTIPVKDATKRGREFDAYFAALDSYNEALDAAPSHPLRADQILAAADAQFTRASMSVTDSEIRGLYRMTMRGFALNQLSFRAQAKASLGLIDKPVADFETADYFGDRHRLSDFRGKVVVLDSFNRSCSACMLLMPQIKQLADDFKDKPVVFLGMNSDEPADGRVVIDAFELKYPVLYFPDQRPFAPSMIGNPSVFIIDQKGILREAHCGYSPTLGAHLSKVVQSMLDESSTTRPTLMKKPAP